MTKRMKLLLAAAALVVLGVVVILLQPGPPKGECVSGDGPTSGYSDPEQGNCPLSVESAEERADYISSPKPFRIAGLVIIVGGLATAGVGAFAGRKGTSDDAQDPGAPVAGAGS